MMASMHAEYSQMICALIRKLILDVCWCSDQMLLYVVNKLGVVISVINMLQ